MSWDYGGLALASRERYEGGDPGDEAPAPGKRTLTAGMSVGHGEPSLRPSLARARAQIEALRADLLPRLRDTVAARTMRAARDAVFDVEQALATIDRELDAARRLDLAAPELDELAAARDALRAEAAPLVALAPPPAPALPDPGPWKLAFAPPPAGYDDAERDNEERWAGRLDAAGGRHDVSDVPDRETTPYQPPGGRWPHEILEDGVAARDAALDHEPPETQRRRMFLLDNIRDQLAGVFGLLRGGAELFIASLRGSQPSVKDSPEIEDLLEIAASAAISGVIGVTANTVAKALTGKGLKDLAERGITDGLKDAIKQSLQRGSATKANATDADLFDQFAMGHVTKLYAAESAFLDEYWTERAEVLYKLDLSDLEAMSASVAGDAQREVYAEAQARCTAVEWINFLARAHHGKLLWDEDGGADGASGDARETEHTRKGQTAAQGNANPAGVRHLLDGDQRKMEDDHHGLLEIHLWLEDGELKRYTRDSERGLRLDNVHPKARAKLASMGRVADAHVNKIVRVYKDLGSGQINPRPPGASIFVSADGYIRSWSYDGYIAFDDAEMIDAVEFAESLPLSLLE